VLGGVPADEPRLVVTALAFAVAMDRHVHDHVRPHTDGHPSTGHCPSERFGEPLLSLVLDRVECITHDAVERGAPFELQERLGHIPG
jgi:hypothetical protein